MERLAVLFLGGCFIVIGIVFLLIVLAFVVVLING